MKVIQTYFCNPNHIDSTLFWVCFSIKSKLSLLSSPRRLSERSILFSKKTCNCCLHCRTRAVPNCCAVPSLFILHCNDVAEKRDIVNCHFAGRQVKFTVNTCSSWTVQFPRSSVVQLNNWRRKRARICQSVATDNCQLDSLLARAPKQSYSSLLLSLSPVYLTFKCF